MFKIRKCFRVEDADVEDSVVVDAVVSVAEGVVVVDSVAVHRKVIIKMPLQRTN